MSKNYYKSVPGGCGFSNNLTLNMVPVVLEDLAVHGSRPQRRYALRELRKINKKNSVKQNGS
jgi:hypothetical protein